MQIILGSEGCSLILFAVVHVHTDATVRFDTSRHKNVSVLLWNFFLFNGNKRNKITF